MDATDFAGKGQGCHALGPALQGSAHGVAFQSLQIANGLHREIRHLPGVSHLQFLAGQQGGYCQGVEVLPDQFQFLAQKGTGRAVVGGHTLLPLENHQLPFVAQPALGRHPVHRDGRFGGFITPCGAHRLPGNTSRQQPFNKNLFGFGLEGKAGQVFTAQDFQRALHGQIQADLLALARFYRLSQQHRLGLAGRGEDRLEQGHGCGPKGCHGKHAWHVPTPRKRIPIRTPPDGGMEG